MSSESESNGNLPTGSDNPFERPALLGCTWYTYGLDAPPWGVAQSDFLIGSTPSAILVSPTLVCDSQAFEQERLARDLLGWTSSEVLVTLRDRGVLETIDFGPSVKKIFDDHGLRSDLREILASNATSDVLAQVRAIDNLISDGLSAENTATASPKPRQPFYWAEGSAYPRPFWSGADKVILTLFLDSDFYLLPPKTLWSPEAREALTEVIQRQASHLDDLARLRVDPSTYLRKIKDAHGKYDEVIDNFLRKHSSPPFGNYQNRLKLLLETRNVIQKSPLIQDMKREWHRVLNGSIQMGEFCEQFEQKLAEDSKGLLKVRRQNNRDIAVNFTFSLLSLSGIVEGLLQGDSTVVAVSTIGKVRFLSKLVDNILERLMLRKNYPMGYLELRKRKLKG